MGHQFISWCCQVWLPFGVYSPETTTRHSPFNYPFFFPVHFNLLLCYDMQAINEKIISLNYGGCTAEIKTVDAQESLGGGVIVLVTGYLTGKDNVRRNFTQSFFLATQDKGYFVLNDIFRFTEDVEYHEGNRGLIDGTVASMTPEQSMEEGIYAFELAHVCHQLGV